MTDRTAYIVTGQYTVYHEDDECRYVANAASVRETTVGALAGMRDPCAVCVTAPEDALAADGGPEVRDDG